MDSKILQSIVEITRQRDLDSMETSLVATLAEYLPVIGISILKSIDNDGTTYVEEAVCLSIDNTSENSFSWSTEASIHISDKYFDTCVNYNQVTSYKHANGFTRLLIPISIDDLTIGCLVIDSYENLSSHMELIKGFIKIYENYMVISNESERDKLTGLYNRRTFDNKISKLFKTQRIRNKQYLASSNHEDRRSYEDNANAWLIVTDIDHFKRVNDTYGHVFGDEVILIISQLMKSCFRNSDLLFRVGGEEFVILLEPVSKNIAENLIERFRQTVADYPFSQIGTITISAGYTKITEKDFPPALLECADRALYYAKEHGRNSFYNYEKLLDQKKISPPKKGGAIDLF